MGAIVPRVPEAFCCYLPFHFIWLFRRSELDHLHSSNASAQGMVGMSSTSRYAESFHTVLHLSVSPNERPRQGAALVFPWETLPPESSRKPMLCFSDAFEMRSVMSPAALKAAGKRISVLLSFQNHDQVGAG